ncbi:MAG TPA: hypothetical protein VFL57_19210, partial [Bryobacteraceae bacterium]|nr:hypothetical protein [Bryobacteraceae bacterium]
YGGRLGASSPCTGEVWILSNANGNGGTSTWSLLPASGAPTRFMSSVAYNPAANTLIVFGGNTCFNTSFNDVWVLSNANGLGGPSTWTQLTPSGTPPNAFSPTTSQSYAAYDATNNRLLLMTGSESFVLTHADGTTGSPAWISTGLFPASARTNGIAIYDTPTNRMTIFGGNAASFFDELWDLSSANGLGPAPAWMQVIPVSSPNPSGRSGSNVGYDQGAGRMIMVFGVSAAGDLNEAWVLSRAPAPLYQVCLLYDPTKPARANSTIPVRVQLCDSAGTNLSSSAISLQALNVTLASSSISSAPEDAGNANPDSNFRYDPTLGITGGYIYNLSTKGLATGTYNLNFRASTDAATIYTAQFQVK